MIVFYTFGAERRIQGVEGLRVQVNGVDVKTLELSTGMLLESHAFMAERVSFQ